MMQGQLRQLGCDPICGFLVRSHDEKELLDIARKHASKVHNLTVTDKELRDKIQNA